MRASRSLVGGEIHYGRKCANLPREPIAPATPFSSVAWRPIESSATGADRRYTLFAVALILLAGLPVFSGFVGAGWELSQLAGLGAAVLCICLCGAPVRARNPSPPALLSLRWHTLMGWGAVVADTYGAVIAHLRPAT
jgi:hypothetical protein